MKEVGYCLHCHGRNCHCIGASYLTPREWEAVVLAAQACDNKTIAWRMQISAGTVNCHLVSIYKKLGLEGSSPRVALALWYKHQMHLPRPPRPKKPVKIHVVGRH